MHASVVDTPDVVSRRIRYIDASFGSNGNGVGLQEGRNVPPSSAAERPLPARVNMTGSSPELEGGHEAATGEIERIKASADAGQANIRRMRGVFGKIPIKLRSVLVKAFPAALLERCVLVE